MRSSIAHIASAVVVAAIAVTTTACGLSSSPSSGLPNSAPSGLVAYDSSGLGYLLSYSAPSGGGKITGTITIAQQCQEQNGSTHLYKAGPFPVTGTYSPQAQLDDTFEFNAASQNIGGQPQDIIGGIPAPVDGYAEPAGSGNGLFLGDSEDWNDVSNASQFYSMVKNSSSAAGTCIFQPTPAP
jgi:hypothetical protein